jgi:hypothetical protein
LQLKYELILTYTKAAMDNQNVTPLMRNSHKNPLLRNHWANCKQAVVEWSLDGPLSNLHPVIPTSYQDGRQAKNRKKRGVT